VPRDTPATRRAYGRRADELRPVSIELGVQKFADGSAQVEMGDTRVLVAATIERRVPPFLTDSGQGWASAEYSMLPRSTTTRVPREVNRGRPSGRTSEIQRLIGRSIRSVLDLRAMPDRTLLIDCDVIQADGGTRTASVTGAYVAAAVACAELVLRGEIERWPFREPVAAISAGIVDGVLLLDLDASEDQTAEADFNIVATGSGRLVEVQGTGEKRSFTREELDALLDLAFAGMRELAAKQQEVLAERLSEVEQATSKRSRAPAPAKSEKDLWGRP
jgi:ribonuclease PH